MPRNSDTTRRTVLKTIGAAPLIASTTACTVQKQASFSFLHGVASGDPLKDRVILWTRVQPLDASSTVTDTVAVYWQLAADDSFAEIVAEGQAATSAERDFTVKVDATGLAPGRSYAYRFIVDGTTSPVGRTQTLKGGKPDLLRLAIVSCSNYPQGFFNAYKALADRDVDLVLHLGDYIYEYASGVYADQKMIEKGRRVDPPHEIITLDDYRRRYRLYRGDPDLQAVHGAHPFICVWDDHEIANDAHKTGAQNHDPETEGSFAERRANAQRAYMEWLPIRETADTAAGKIYRRFDVGDLASVIMLDTRMIGRDKQLSYQNDIPPRTLPFDMSDAQNPRVLLNADAIAAVPAAAIQHVPVPFDMSTGTPVPITDLSKIKAMDPANMPPGTVFLPDLDAFERDILAAPERHMLGAKQEGWLAAQLQDSVSKGVKWQLLGQQLLMGKVPTPSIAADAIDFDRSQSITRDRFDFFQMLAGKKMPLNLDAWDGYPAARARVFDMIRAAGANAVVVAGDTHNSWAFNLRDTDGAVAVEIGTPGVSSPGLESYIPAPTDIVEAALKQASDEMIYVDARRRGWVEIDIMRDKMACRWHLLTTVKERRFTVSVAMTVDSIHGDHVLTTG